MPHKSPRSGPGRRRLRLGLTTAIAAALVPAVLTSAGLTAAASVVPAASAQVPQAVTAPAVDPATAATAATAAATVAAETGPAAAKPYMGWSSWSLQSTNYPGVNPDGPGSFITEKNILAQAQAMATKLKPFGYEYINIDAGWQLGGDQWGRPVANTKRFPRGMKAVGEDIHALGLKFGIYTVVGLGKDVYNEGNMPVYGTTDCFSRDLVYPDLRTTNGWDMSYKINYASPCAQKYVDSIVNTFADWKVDYIKMDGVGPGSFRGGENYDNREDVEAWYRSVQASGREMLYTLSWSMSHKYVDDWKANSNGWRIDTDVECYCDTIVRWDASVKQRWWDVVQWIDDTGPGAWNNLDAVVVGNAEMDGLTEAERQSHMTFWAIQAAPLFSGDDLTKLDAYGLKLLTNREVIAINQAGRPARPVSQSSLQQTWYTKNADGSTTVALFNLGDSPASVTGRFDEVGITGSARVRDVWAGQNLGSTTGQVSATLPAHGSKLFRITPNNLGALGKPSGVHATDVSRTTTSLAWDATAGATSYRVYAGGRELARVSTPKATVTGLTPATAYKFEVKAYSAARSSAASAPVELTTSKNGGPVKYEAEADTNPCTGNASVSGCGACSGGNKVGNIGGDGTFTLTGLNVPVAGTYLLKIAYTDGDSSRQGILTVNDTTPYWVNFHGTGDNDWGTPQVTVQPVQLKAGANTIKVSNPGGYMADIDYVIL
ncbi:fibronectin type III domain-containing protein [Kribbella sp. NBC_01245]|uniref:fibronectin type III domain-containing protein n=1 Tax=Kribbella sp. NBC_01245 TaxID=2903578 RepID=UPI002E293932|nr:CBM35 domain-containing protein [Kribbella sp. NBC_01245]